MHPMMTEWEGAPLHTWAAAWGVPQLLVWDRVTSTNDVLLAYASEGAPVHTVVIADEQSEGRGRRGADWFSPSHGGLWISFLACPGPESAPVLPLLSGIAAARAIEKAVSGWRGSASRVGLKWPNDLIIADRKVGGVLCEAVGDRVVIGIGINVRATDQDLPREIADRAGAVEGFAVTPVCHSELAGALVRDLAGLTETAGRVIGVTELAELRDRDVLSGRRVITEQAGEGVAIEISPEGMLLLERPDGSRVSVVAGSVRPIL
jgi:BirA family biotin operon repressor/biotin-[acetyl-CoA-carboxylase] ligase